MMTTVIPMMMMVIMTIAVIVRMISMNDHSGDERVGGCFRTQLRML